MDERNRCNKVVLDLEMSRVPGNSSFAHSHEIIQIGAVMLDEDYMVISEFSTYVHPEYSKVDQFITRLTGIEKSNTDTAPSLKDAVELFMDWMNHFKLGNIYTWSETDFSQLSYELNYKKLQDSKTEQLMCADRWVDYQEIFGERYGYNRAVSLEDALAYSEIFPEGRAHNGLDDAFNTAQLISKLETHPEYMPCVGGEETRTKEALTFSLGDFLGSFFTQNDDRVAV